MDSQETGWRQRLRANRFASTVVILATLIAGHSDWHGGIGGGQG